MKTLGIISENLECPLFGNGFTIRFDLTKIVGARYFRKNCRKRFAVRSFTPFAEISLDIGNILHIFALFSTNTSVKEICEKVVRSN